MSRPDEVPPVSDDLRLDRVARNRLRAVVFDANAFGHARPNIGYLRAIAQRLSEVNIETWVPELVAWEWAQHLSEDWRTLTTSSSTERSNLASAELRSPDPIYSDEADVVEAFLAVLRSINNVTIVELTPGNAAAGLRDQIMLTGPAARKKDTKTGASDSAWLRDCIDRADGIEDLIFVTEDKGIKTACEQWGYGKPLTRTRSELRATLFEVELDTGTAAWQVLSHLSRLLPAPIAAGPTTDQAVYIGKITGLESAIESDDREWADVRAHAAELTRLKMPAGIRLVTVEQRETQQNELSPVRRTISASVAFLATGRATVSYNDEDTQIRGYDDLLVIAELSFEVENERIISMRADGDAVAHLPSTNFRDGDDAIMELQDALAGIPGVTGEVGLLKRDDPDESYVLVSPVGTADLAIHWPRYLDEWATEIRVSVNDDAIVNSDVISCEHDVGARVGGADGWDLYPPFVVSGDGPIASENPIWAVPAWVIATALGHMA